MSGAHRLPDGTPVDAGFVTWHDDGTELMNSGRTHDGNGHTGKFRLTQYVNNGIKTPINDVQGAPVAFVILGTVSATRVTVE